MATGPHIASITPNNSMIAGGIPVVLSGSGLAVGLIVYFDGISAVITNITNTDVQDTVTCIAPSHVSGIINVQGYYPSSDIYSNSVNFTYNADPTLRQIVGGNFQDAGGNSIADGYITFRLSEDGTNVASGNNIQVSSGIIVKSTLDSNGNIYGVTPIWANDTMTPSGTYYLVKVYTADGELCWQSQQTIPSGSGTFDIGSWVPLT